MTRLIVGLVAFSATFSASIAQAQETYTIKLKEASRGDSYRATTKERMKSVTNLTDSLGKSLKQNTVAFDRSLIFLVTILEKAPGQKKPTALSRDYEKAVIVADGETRISSLEGKIVMIEKKGDKYEFRLGDGKELSAVQEAELGLELNKDPPISMEQAMMPTQAVKLNESWVVDTGVLANALDSGAAKVFDIPNAERTAKLVRVYLKDGRQFGIVEFNLKLTYKEPAAGNFVIKGSYDGCIDGSSLCRTVNVSMATEIRVRNETHVQMATIAFEKTEKMEEIRPPVKKK